MDLSQADDRLLNRAAQLARPTELLRWPTSTSVIQLRMLDLCKHVA